MGSWVAQSSEFPLGLADGIQRNASMTFGTSLAAGTAGVVFARHQSAFRAPLLICKVYSLYTWPLSQKLTLLRPGSWLQRLEPARERFRGWMRTSDARPLNQLECSCITTKVLSLSLSIAPNTHFSIAS